MKKLRSAESGEGLRFDSSCPLQEDKTIRSQISPADLVTVTSHPTNPTFLVIENTGAYGIKLLTLLKARAIGNQCRVDIAVTGYVARKTSRPKSCRPKPELCSNKKSSRRRN